MALDLGTLVLRLSVDDQIKPGLSRAKGEITQFASEAGRGGEKAGKNVGVGVSKGVASQKSNIEQSGRQAGDAATKGLDTGLKGSQSSILKLAGKAGIGLIGVSALKTGLDTASGMETARMGFTTMLGSAQKADVFLKQLSDFAAKTPFEFPELQTAANSLISAGVEADKVIPIMRTLGDVTAGMGTGAEGVERATVAIQQMNAAGRITAEDLNQLRDAGIPVYDLLAAATGRSKAEVAGLAQAGKLGKTELDAMMKALESGAGLERFNGLMEKTSTSLSGLWSTLQDTFSQGMATAIAPAIPLIKSGLGGAIAFTSDHLDEAIVAAGAFFGVWSVQKIGGLIGSLSEMTVGFGRLSSGLGKASAFLGGPWGIAIGLGVTALGLLVAKQQMAAAETKAFTDQLTFQKGALDENSKQMIVKKLADEGALEAAHGAGIAEADYVAALLAGGDARDQMLAKLGDIIVSTNDAANQTDGNTQALFDQNTAAMKAQDILKSLGTGLDNQKRAAQLADSATKGLASSTGNAADKSGILAAAQNDLKGAQEKLRKETQKLIDKFTILRDGSLSQEQANNAWEVALDAVRASVKENGRTLDSHSEKGRANRSVIVDMITALNDKVVADFKSNVQTMGLKRATELASVALQTGREKIDATARASRLSKEEVKRMQDRMLQTPHELRTQVNTPGIKTAQSNVTDLKKRIADVDGKSASINVHVNTSLNDLNRSLVKKYGKGAKLIGLATGGPVPGYSPHSKADNIPAMLTAREFVQPVSAVDHYGVDAMEAIRQRRVPKDAFIHRADGGTVNRQINVSASAGKGLKHYGAFGDAMLLESAQAGMAYGKAIAAAAIKAYGGSAVGGGGYANALKWARSQAGAPYTWAAAGPKSVGYDCSGFMGAIQNVIEGKDPYHRRWSTGAFNGQQHAMGFTKNKVSPFRIGVTNAGVGHTAGTLNGVNVESSGGRGVHLGSGARGWNDGLFPMHYGLAKGGLVGNPPFDLIDPRGKHYDRRWNRMFSGYASGTSSAAAGVSGVAEGGSELVVNPQFRKFKGGERVFDAKETEQLFADAHKGQGWSGSPLIGKLEQNFPASMDIRTASAVAGSMTVAKLRAVAVGR